MVGEIAVGPGANAESIARLNALALEAGVRILEHYRAGSDAAGPVSKTDGSPVTEADLDAQRVIVRELEAWDPSIPIISEEAALPAHEARSGWSRFWLVDPLDGTKEFISRNGEFTINIALIENGEPVLGVVYAPALEIMYTAAKGLGAWKIGKDGKTRRIHHIPADPSRPLTVVESRSHGSPELEKYLETIQVGKRVRVGSSLKFCWVAEGRADVYPRLGPTMEWDVAAGDCIYRNSAREGQHDSPLRYNKPDLRNESFIIGVSD